MIAIIKTDLDIQTSENLPGQRAKTGIVPGKPGRL